MPVIFLTGHADVPMCAQAMKRGAVDFLTKPVDETALFAARGPRPGPRRGARLARAQREATQSLLATLTAREREVLMHVIAGRLNKQIAADLGTAEKTIKVHRARAWRRCTCARSLSWCAWSNARVPTARRRKRLSGDPTGRLARSLDQGLTGRGDATGLALPLMIRTTTPVIAVVDDEESVRRALGRLIRAAGFHVETYASGTDFPAVGAAAPAALRRAGPAHAACQRVSRAAGADGGGHVPADRHHHRRRFRRRGRHRALEQGARAYLRKPVDDALLLDAIQTAIRANE
jgi:FixJ family two-component response regulator